MMLKRPVPYDFIFDYLPEQTVVKTQFGMHYVYLNKRIVLLLRQTEKGDGLNGIWVASSRVHHKSLTDDVPGLGEFLLDTGETYDSHWRFLPENCDCFESSAIRIAELISRGDKRIGKETKGSRTL